MNETQARVILKEAIRGDNSLGSCDKYYIRRLRSDELSLGGSFTIEELEAILWWIKNKNLSTNQKGGQ